MVITGFFNNALHFTTHTDAAGHYAVPVNPGLYKVMVSDSDHTFFVPPFDVVNVKNTSKTANFEGLLFNTLP